MGLIIGIRCERDCTWSSANLILTVLPPPAWHLSWPLLSACCRFSMLCCHYFAKNVPRFLEAKAARVWDVFETEELRDKTIGLIG